jgi:putative ABC transport system ATP-binding protein
MKNNPFIQCENIKKVYGTPPNQTQALKGITLDIYPGELTLLVGPSGSGKTTLLSILSNILTADEGNLFLLGQDVSTMDPHEKASFCRKHIGILFQSYFLVPTLNLAENVAVPLLIEGEDYDRCITKALDFLKRFQLDHRYELSPSILSKGQQQKVAMARAMIKDADILLCDEPTSALDHVSGAEVMTILHEICKEKKKAVVVVTHDHRIFKFADRIINMSDGSLNMEAP